jgi:hypothetical protein
MTRSALILAAVLVCGAAEAADAPYTPEARGIVAAESVRLPACDSPGVFKKIATAFQDKESEYWHSDLTLVSFEPPVQLGYRPWGAEFIARRFCLTRTMVSDGIVREVYYSIGHQTGTLGIKNGVDWCVTGLDRNLAYSPDCKMAGP